MKPRWFIQDSLFASWRPDREAINTQCLIFAIKELGLDVHVGKYIPFGGMEYDFFEGDDPVIFYGSINLILDFQRRKPKPWKPVAWFDEDALSCHTYYTHLNKFILQQNHSFFRFGDLPGLKNHLFNNFAVDNKIFIRPDDNIKSFNGRIIEQEYFDSWVSSPSHEDVSQDVIAVVSSPSEIEAEWRLIIADGKVLTGSQYMNARCYEVKDGFPVKDMLKFMSEVEKEWKPHPIYCMDVCRLTTGEFRVVEIGSINCAGFHRCDLRSIVKIMSEIAMRECEKPISVRAWPHV